MPNFTFENECWKRGVKLLGGIDEVGRGALAGPVVASCVVFPANFLNDFPSQIIIKDSKKLTPKQRNLANIWIQSNCIFGIGIASVVEINNYGIVKATHKANRRAIKSTKIDIEELLIDAFYIPGIFKGRQKAIIRGDNLSISIAAASIVAKVYRDELMANLAVKPKYQKYFWQNNKGYGTLTHRNAIKKHGTTNLHRNLFVRKIISNNNIPIIKTIGK